MESSSPGSIRIKGKVTEGLKESGYFTGLPWVRRQFIAKLGIDPYPGTLNLDIIDTEDLARLRQIRNEKGIEIEPSEPGFCSANCFQVLIDGRVKGCAIIPRVTDYPEGKLEIISSDHIREVLSLNIGDTVSVDLNMPEKGIEYMEKTTT